MRGSSAQSEIASPGAGPVARRIVQVGLLLGLCLTPSLSAEEALPVNKIEEDWEVVIGEPNADETAPQLYVVTTPTGDLSGQYAVFEINNVTLPDFYGGGLQFQTWWDDQATGEAHHDDFSSLATAGETIKFTISMRVWGDGTISYRVKNGQSQTWGTFGADYSLWIRRQSDLTNLSGYSPETSARFSRVGFGRGRVSKFQIKQVRYYNANDSTQTLLNTDDTVRDAQIDEPT
ncbi:MAG: hypothetical protein ACT4QC_04900 [Planctomycetaceae bacterium]